MPLRVVGVPCVEVPVAVDRDAVALALAWCEDVDGGEWAAPRLPEKCGAEVTEYCALAAGEHGRHPEALLRQLSVPDGVHASMDPMQPPALHPVRHRGLSEPDLVQLRDRHDPVLPPGEDRERCVF